MRTVGADKRRAPFGVFFSDGLDEDDLFYEEDVDGLFDMVAEEEECIYVGQAWEHPNAMGTCYYNCRDLGELDDVENGSTLEQLMARRAAALTASMGRRAPDHGNDEAISSSSSSSSSSNSSGGGDDVPAAAMPLDALAEVWQILDDDEAQLQLLSFAATATLSPLDRVRALAMKGMPQRLRYALEALGEQEEILSQALAEAAR